MSANVSASATAFPVRGSAAGADIWEQVDQLEQMQMRLEAEEAERRLAALVLRMRRRLAGEQRRMTSRRRGRR